MDELGSIKDEHMKALFLTSIYLIFSIQISYSQDWIEDTCALYGDVKKVSYKMRTSNDYDKSFYLEKSTTYYNPEGFSTKLIKSDNLMGENYQYGYSRIYDENGTKCLKHFELESRDTLRLYNFLYSENSSNIKAVYYSNGRHWSTFNYIYNEKKQLVECYVVIRKDNDTIWTNYEYDITGKKTKETYISETVKTITIWEYNEIGLLEKKVFLDSNWATRTKRIINDQGEIIKETNEDFSSSPNTEESYIIDYSYDVKGRLIGSVKTNLDSTLLWESKIEYNNDGTISKSYEYDIIANKKFESNHYYTYDELGNWLSRKIISEDGVVEEKQKIKYY